MRIQFVGGGGVGSAGSCLFDKNVSHRFQLFHSIKNSTEARIFSFRNNHDLAYRFLLYYLSPCINIQELLANNRVHFTLFCYQQRITKEATR